MNARDAHGRGDATARAVPPRRPRARARARALGRHGPAAHGGPGDHAPARRPVPRRADRRPRPAEPPRAVGRSSASCTRDGQTIVLTTHYMEEADQLCDRVAIIDHGQLLALDTPGRAEGVDRRRHDRHRHGRRRPRRARRAPRRADRRASTRRGARRRHGACSYVDRADGVLPAVVTAAETRRLHASPTSRSPRRRSRPSSSTSPEGTSANERPPPSTSRARYAAPFAVQRSPVAAARVAFGALLLRDLAVLRKNARGVPPAARSCSRCCSSSCSPTCSRRSARAIGGGGAGAADVLDAARRRRRSRSSMIFQGVQAVALPLVQDFGYTREIEDRVLAPMPVWAVAVEKVAAGAFKALFAALVVFPLAAFIPATPVHLARATGWSCSRCTPLALLTCGRARADDRHPRRAPRRCRCSSASS